MSKATSLHLARKVKQAAVTEDAASLAVSRAAARVYHAQVSPSELLTSGLRGPD